MEILNAAIMDNSLNFKLLNACDEINRTRIYPEWARPLTSDMLASFKNLFSEWG